jgi:hypothetical protein
MTEEQTDRPVAPAAEPVGPVASEGAFIASLKRNNTKIRADRAEAIGEDAQVKYRRQIEDLQLDIKRMRRDQENMLDMSPDHAMSLKLATDFEADEYVAKDIELGVRIRNTSIKLEIATTRYEYLFGTGVE